MLDEKEPSVANDNSPDTAFLMLKKLESTVSQNLAIVANEVQELHRSQSITQGKLDQVDNKLSALGQRAICSDELRGLQQAIESDLALLTSDQTCGINDIITKHIDKSLVAFREEIISRISDMMKPVTASTPIFGDIRDFDVREGSSGIAGDRAPDASASIFCRMCNSYGKNYK